MYVFFIYHGDRSIFFKLLVELEDNLGKIRTYIWDNKDKNRHDLFYNLYIIYSSHTQKDVCLSPLLIWPRMLECFCCSLNINIISRKESYLNK